MPNSRVTMPQKTTMTLLERKRIQWEREKEELIGLNAPWGPPPNLKMSTSCTSLPDGITNLSTLNKYGGSGLENKTTTSNSGSVAIVSPTYMKELGLLSATTQSEYHLPPISFERSKGHDSEPLGLPDLNLKTPGGNGSSSDGNYWLNRKRSLPSCIFTPNGVVCNTQSNNCGHQERLYNVNLYHATEKGQRPLRNDLELGRLTVDKWKTYHHPDEDPYTSGYQSETNPYQSDGSGESRNGTAESGQNRRYLKANLLARHEESYVYTCEGDFSYNTNGNNTWAKPGSYLYSKRNEMDHYEIQHGNEQSNSGRHLSTKSSQAESLEQKTWSYVNSRMHIPPPAMRSSFTTSLDAPDKDAYQDLKKQEHDKWLRDLQQQREEQRLRRQMEKDEKNGRAKWGDRGVVVGHLWEPAAVPNARLPPTTDQEGSFPLSSHSPAERREYLPPKWSAGTLEEVDFVQREKSIDLEMARPAFLEQKNQASCSEGQRMSEREEQMRRALQHQEAIKKQMEERQQLLKAAHEKRIEEEKAEEAKILAYRLDQLQKFDLAKRQELIKEQEQKEVQVLETGTLNRDLEQSNNNLFAFKNPGDIDAFYRQLQIENAYLMRKNLATTITLPPISVELESPRSSKTQGSRSASPFQEYEATVVKEVSLPPVRHRNETSQSTSSTTQELGTQTDLEEAEVSVLISKEGATEETLTHDNGNAQEKYRSRKKSARKKERPKWGIPQPTKQYMKQSEKDPHYQHRLQRRLDRQKRRECQLKVKSTLLERKTLCQNTKVDVTNKGNVRNGKCIKIKMENIIETDVNSQEEFTGGHCSDSNVGSTIENVCSENCKGIDHVISINQNKNEAGQIVEQENDPVLLEVEPTTLALNATVDVKTNVDAHDEAVELDVITVNAFRTDSPPVPALLKKLQLGSDIETNDIDFHSTDPVHDLNLKSTKVAAFQRKLEGFKESPAESESAPKMSPATILIESTAEYFSSPENFTERETDISSSRAIPFTPPDHLKSLIYGIHDLSNYLPLNGSQNGSPSPKTSPSLKSELSKGPFRNRTIEFTIKFPAEYYQQNGRHLEPAIIHQDIEYEEGGWRRIHLPTEKEPDVTQIYVDPLRHAQKTSTMEWLGRKNGSRKDSAIMHLTAMRKGIRHQQEEWIGIPSDSEIEGGSFYASSFYPSSERSSSSN